MEEASGTLCHMFITLYGSPRCNNFKITIHKSWNIRLLFRSHVDYAVVLKTTPQCLLTMFCKRIFAAWTPCKRVARHGCFICPTCRHRRIDTAVSTPPYDVFCCIFRSVVPSYRGFVFLGMLPQFYIGVLEHDTAYVQRRTCWQQALNRDVAFEELDPQVTIWHLQFCYPKF